MNTKILIYSGLLFLIIHSCSGKPEAKEKINADFIFGKWTFINTKEPIDYAEIDFEEKNTYVVKSEEYGQNGPLPFRIVKDSILLGNKNFLILIESSVKIQLVSDDEAFLLFKIPFDENSLEQNQVNPFYLRRCYFLVHLNVISMEEASKYLFDIKQISDSLLPKTEIIQIY